MKPVCPSARTVPDTKWWPEFTPASSKAWRQDSNALLFHGDARRALAGLPAGCVQTCITSPPYWSQRDYGSRRQLGQELDPALYVRKLVAVFGEVRRVLRDDGTLWLNLGDTYRDKQMLGLPWRVALALQADGWVLRSESIWHKPNAQPGSYRDRPTVAHEPIFQLTKATQGYYYDCTHLREPAGKPRQAGKNAMRGQAQMRARGGGNSKPSQWRNMRTVRACGVGHSGTAHLATFPQKLIEPLVPGSCPAGGIVLDPFNGVGTVGVIARKHGRRYIGIDVRAKYLAETARALTRL